MEKEVCERYHSPFMNKTLPNAIMVRTKLRNTFLIKRSEENKKRYNMQRNCVSLLQKVREATRIT